MSEKAARINRLFVGRCAMETSIISTASDKTVQIEELKAFIRKQRDGREVKKALAVKLLYQGYQLSGAENSRNPYELWILIFGQF